MENPWSIQSLYDLQYFNCPSCIFKNQSKQELVNHAYEAHPESVEYLMNINDKSTIDIIFPWNEPTTEKVNDDHLKVKIENTYEDFVESSNEICEYEIKNSDDLIDKFSNVESMEDPLRIIKPVNKGVKNHFCDLCGKSFSLYNSLTRHFKSVHEGVKDYNCSLCGKGFSRPDRLKRHVKTVHEGVKDHVCNLCDKSYANAQSLKSHVEIVHKDHDCYYCEKSFTIPQDLRQHIKAVHEGHVKKDKDHFCDQCGKNFTRHNALTRHIRAVLFEGSSVIWQSVFWQCVIWLSVFWQYVNWQNVIWQKLYFYVYIRVYNGKDCYIKTLQI